MRWLTEEVMQLVKFLKKVALPKEQLFNQVNFTHDNTVLVDSVL